MRKIDSIGQKFNKLTVISEHSSSRGGRLRYNCLCDCGNTCEVLAGHLRANTIKSCGCAIGKRDSHYHWTGIGELSGNFWNRLLRNATKAKRRRALEFTITKQYVWELYIKQDKKCALSGLEIKFPSNWKDKTFTASLDRIDSSKGYTPDNVQWVHKDINLMKNKFNEAYFIELCNSVVKCKQI